VPTQRRHWPRALGNDTTRVMSASSVPAGTSRFCVTSNSTSRWTSTWQSNTRASITELTVPSIEFSMATNPAWMVPASTSARISVIDCIETSSPAARSAWVMSASSPNEPGGPRNPTLVPTMVERG